MSTKRGRPTLAAVAARERRAREKYQRRLGELEEATKKLYDAADIFGATDWTNPEYALACNKLQQAAHRYVDANAAAGRAFV